MLLAQATNGSDTAVWGAAGAFVLMIFTQLGKMMSDFFKNKRELESDKLKQEYLKRIADSNEAAFRAQLEVKTTLVVANALDKMRHDTLLKAIESMGNNCKELNKPKH